VRQAVTQELQARIEGQIANAKGIRYLVVRDTRTGKFLRVTEAMARTRLGRDEEVIEVWEKDPNVQAFIDLMNRAIDKPREQARDIQVTQDEEQLRLLLAGRARAAAMRLQPGLNPATQPLV